MANEKGVWRTIGGRRVFIKEGQDLASAMKESGKFKSASKGTAKKPMTEEEKAKRINETMDRRSEVIDRLDKETYGLDNYDRYNLAVSKLENTEGMRPTERQYWAGIKERYEKNQKANSDREELRNTEKEYGELSKKMQADDYYYKPEDDRKLKELRAKADSERARQGIDTQEKYDKLMSEDSNKKEKPFDVRKYEVEVQHDNGKAKINVTASDEEEAKKIVMNAERAPESAIVGVKDKGSILYKDEDSKKMTTPLGKEDDTAKIPYEKGEKYRNSIIETAKNSKEDNVTLDTETGKVATFDKGYSVSFQQSSDNYDDKEYYEKVEECRNKCDGKLYAGKYGGDAEASFHTDDIETAKELMYKYNQESIYDWEHETLIMNDKYDSSSNKTNYEAEKSTNDIMNEKIRSRGKAEDDLPKHVEIKSQGTSNRKEVSENIQAHILEHYDSPEDFIEQMDAYDWKPTMWHRGEALAEDGFYEIYYEDQRKFLDDLKINPKGKNFSDDRVFQTYKSLIGRESAKLYDRIQKNSYKKYMKAHPLSKMSFEEFKNMRGGK